MRGAGAIGSIIGASVTPAGHTLIDMWPAHLEQTQAHGLKVAAAEAGELTVSVSAVHLGEVAGLRTEFDALPTSILRYALTGQANRTVSAHEVDRS